MRRRTLLAAGTTLLAGCATTGRRATPADDAGAGGAAGSPTAAAETAETESGTDSRTETATDDGAGADASAEDGEAAVVVRRSDLRREPSPSGGTAYVRAAVTNRGTAPTGVVEARATFRDGAGRTLATPTNHLTRLAPGETWLAYVPYGGDAAETATHEFAAAVSPPASVGPARGLTLTGSDLRTTPVGASVRGRVRNDRGERIERVRARVAFYADETTLLATNVADATGVAPGETWAFRAPYLNFGFGRERIARHAVSLAGSTPDAGLPI